MLGVTLRCSHAGGTEIALSRHLENNVTRSSMRCALTNRATLPIRACAASNQPCSQGFPLLPREKPWERGWFPICVLILVGLFFVVFSHILERGAKKGTALDHRSKEPALSAPSKHAPSPVDENRRVEEFEKRLRFAMEQSLYLQAQHLSALDKFEKDLTLAKEESLLSHALFKSRLEAPAREESKKPLKGILKKSRR